ncbi:ADP-binding protein [Salinisphaera dokdonensis CL-ES53]|uniref:tRNA threonylcarbamoyladenosine biosynthesis protein TsaE n=1 Tax=Salinisphaera dokdonensis CL-ES53 TaxID=1304272 RepID=A0ABV2AXP9_9GAMM
MIALADAAATDALGRHIAAALVGLDSGLVVSLAGELGAGKTALARATIQALGHDGHVVSPSYTLVEPYPLKGRTFYHLDLYRLGDPEELEFLGVREIDTGRDWVFVEWAERGTGFLPTPDIELEMVYAGTGREAHASAYSDAGKRFLYELGEAT